jgi:hypothetical protein
MYNRKGITHIVFYRVKPFEDLAGYTRIAGDILLVVYTSTLENSTISYVCIRIVVINTCY